MMYWSQLRQFLSTVYNTSGIKCFNVCRCNNARGGIICTHLIARNTSLPEIRGHLIVGLAKIFHNSFNWMCTFSMGINKNEKLPTSDHLDYFSIVQGSSG